MKCENIFDIDKLKVESLSIEKDMAQPDFFSMNSNAEKMIKIYNTNNKKMQHYEQLNNQYIQLLDFYEMLKQEYDEHLFEEYAIQVDVFKKTFNDFEIQVLLSEPYDQCDAIMELHAGAGGVDSQDWTQMLYRMYTRYFDSEKFEVELLNYQQADEAGIRTATLLIKADYAYGKLKGEYGVHRLVRISPFDAAKKRHTSFALVEVMPVIEASQDQVIHDSELKIDTYRAQGAGGQSVNTTDSAVRITHLPTGIVVSCQNERSQIKNKAQAMKLLKVKLTQHYKSQEHEQLAQLKGEHKEVGFSSQIRSYVFNPYQLVKDHRTGFETGQVDKVMDGDLNDFIKNYLYYLKKDTKKDTKND